MAQTRWTIRNYNAFLREAKRSYGVNHVTAQALYKSMRGRLDHSVRAVDLSRHPRIASKAYKEVTTLPVIIGSGELQEPPDWVIGEIGQLPDEIDIEWWTDNYLDDWADEDYSEYEAMYETTQGEK